jgi:hypothetical protein
MAFVEPVQTPKPLAEDRKVMLGQQSHGDDSLWAFHLF